MNKIVVANWKMNPETVKEAEVVFKSVHNSIKNTKVIVCPPFPYLFIFKKFKSNKILLGSQDISTEFAGSHTGEVSPKMLVDMGVSYTIVGHSERRKKGEDNNTINQKILNLLKFKISPILCVGESIRDKDGDYLAFIEGQIKGCLEKVPSSQIKNIIIAYEPIWAIGKDAKRVATKEEFMEIKIFIKKIISDIYSTKIAHNIIVLYGGSVNPLNAKYFAYEGEADGLLVGRDSINPKKFSAILSTL